MALIQTITDVGFALCGITVEGRVYYANLLGKGDDFVSSFEWAVNDLEAQAQADQTVVGFLFPIAEVHKRDSFRLDHLFTVIKNQQSIREYWEQQVAQIAA